MSKFVSFLVIIMSLSSCEKSVDQSTAKKEQISTEEKNPTQTAEIKEVSAKHILVDSESEAKELLEKIKKNEMTFEEAAKNHSKCPSGKDGGNLGFFGRGMMVKEFEDAAFGLDAGQISSPVKTQFGWHLIKVEEKR